MEKTTKVGMVAVLYLILGVFYVVLGWNAKSWYPNMFVSNTYYGEWGGTIIARVSAIVVGVWQVLIGSCLLQSKHYDGATFLSLVLIVGGPLFAVGVITSGDDPSFYKVSGSDFMWFFNYFVLSVAHILFWLFITLGRKPKVGLGKSI